MAKNAKASNRPVKVSDDELLELIENSIKNKSYYFTTHGSERANERKDVSELQVIAILKSTSKFHEKKKDEYSEEFKAWNYAIRGKTLDDDNVRIVVSFDDKNMLIITVINLDG